MARAHGRVRPICADVARLDATDLARRDAQLTAATELTIAIGTRHARGIEQLAVEVDLPFQLEPTAGAYDATNAACGHAFHD